jgi:hypothetical protein
MENAFLSPRLFVKFKKHQGYVTMDAVWSEAPLDDLPCIQQEFVKNDRILACEASVKYVSGLNNRLTPFS